MDPLPMTHRPDTHERLQLMGMEAAKITAEG
jgi:hypothetical protein